MKSMLCWQILYIYDILPTWVNVPGHLMAWMFLSASVMVHLCIMYFTFKVGHCCFVCGKQVKDRFLDSALMGPGDWTQVYQAV